MPRMFTGAVAVIAAWSLAATASAQGNESRISAARDSIITDRTLGISFVRIGSLTSHQVNNYEMLLQSAEGTIKRASVKVSVSGKRLVDLSGSFGGMLDLDDPAAKSLLKDRVRVDSVAVGDLCFRREYWAVYAGMGAWEGVINCLALVGSQYYALSMSADLPAGKPGEIANGIKSNAEFLQLRVVDALSDSREPVVQQFNALLSSVRLSR
ncbi:MAG TPA: hypothetical protein VI758_03050 [Bacteroidota bacterium]